LASTATVSYHQEGVIGSTAHVSSSYVGAFHVPKLYSNESGGSSDNEDEYLEQSYLLDSLDDCSYEELPPEAEANEATMTAELPLASWIINEFKII